MASPPPPPAPSPPPNATHSNNSPSSPSHSSDEESIKLVWQDDSGADLRSIFAKDMITMTQQIDGWGNSEEEDDSDDECDDGNAVDCRDEAVEKDASELKIESKDNSNPNAAASTNNATEKLPVKPKSKRQPHRKRSLPKNVKLGENNTPPPQHSVLSTKAVHSAETPATISKLQRKKRRRGNVGFVEGGGVQLSTTTNKLQEDTTTDAKNGDDKKKISASQEVDRVFDVLGLPEHEIQEQTMFASTQPADYNTGSALKTVMPQQSVKGRTSTSPMPNGRLFDGATDKYALAGSEKTTTHNNWQKLKKLPPLRPMKNKAIEKENVANRKETGDIEDLFKEIEMGLDHRASFAGLQHDTALADESKVQANESETVAPHLPAAGTKSCLVNHSNNMVERIKTVNKSNSQESGQQPKRGVPGALQPSTFHQNPVTKRDNMPAPTREYTCGKAPSVLPSVKTNVSSLRSTVSLIAAKSELASKTANLTNINVAAPRPPTSNFSYMNKDVANPTLNSNSNKATSTTNQSKSLCPTNNKGNCNDDDEFSDDDWNAEDFAAMDRCIAMTQCKVSGNLLKDDEFDSCIDQDLATMDMDIPPVAIKPITNVQEEDEFGDDDDELAALDLSASIPQHNAKIWDSSNLGGGANNTATVSNVPSNNTSEFSDDDFADGLDFEAIDKQVAQHQKQASYPSKHIPTHNRRSNGNTNTLCFTRYVIRSVEDNFGTSTKTLGVALWTINEAKSKSRDELECLRQYQQNESSCNTNNASSINGYIHLRGIWYYTKCSAGDVIHLISISGQYATDTTALPAVLDSVHASNESNQDDLMLVIHPDELITPTLISEAVTCPRLSVLQQRLGSTGLSNSSAVIGTLRHDLFERCLQEHTASPQAASLFTRQIIRNNAESLIGCGITDQKDAFVEVMKMLPQIQKFFQTYMSWGGSSKTGQMKLTNNYTPKEVLKGEFLSSDTAFSINEVYSTEEMTMCPELGLKGYVDATVEAQTKLKSSGILTTSLMPIELKTGHKQTLQSNHSAQLAVYTMLLRSRHGTSSGITKNGVADGAASSGMLLYLNDKSFNAIHIKPTLCDAKQLIGQRNDVACDTLRASRPRGITIEYNEDARANNSSLKAITKPPVPNAFPALNPKVSECERCYKNRECMMYASSSSNLLNTGHRGLLQHFTMHLTDKDLDYFRKWNRLIDLERHAASCVDNTVKSWLEDSIELEKTDGTCISSLVLDMPSLMAPDEAPAIADRHILRFTRARNTVNMITLDSLGFECGNYVLLSTDTSFLDTARGTYHKMHILKGIVSDIGGQSINVSVTKRDLVHVKRLSEASTNRELTFRLDKDAFASGMGLLYQNLVNFLTLDIPSFSIESKGLTPSKTKSLTANTDDSRRRRRLQSCITQLHPPPRFEKVSTNALFNDIVGKSTPLPGCDLSRLKKEFAKLNSDQKEAIMKVISAEDFALIQGLPGTGKTATVAFLCKLLVAKGYRVLLTSYTHSAVDNLLCKLLDCGFADTSSIVRIGRESSCHIRVKSMLAQNIACDAELASSANKSEPIKTPNVNFLRKVMSSAKVVGVTALTVPKSPLLSDQNFDYVIVDEAGQINQPAILGAITSADKFILVGDHLQLPPLTRSKVAEQEGFGVSMLSHLAKEFPESVAKLTMQYRMNESIQSLSNIVAYNGLLKCGNDEVRSSVLRLKQHPLQQCLPMIDPIDMRWINHAIAPSNPVVFLDTDGLGKGLETAGPANHVESTITSKLVIALSAAGLESSSIGVITPFRSQLRVLNESSAIIKSKKDGLELGTVDVFQGRDKPVIIFSFVRSNPDGKAGRLLKDFRRLNVAFSRAKQKLVIVGSYATLFSGSDVMRPVLDSLRERNWVYQLSSQ